ncbi:hypothetical protein [Actomonas aquatica]|uniref:Uncharacterized protein n=1 Tax=Actomonas aquatica TaxID=2866162 RepID=A0ABZ1C1N7_9BACT|nr:hypothetical protein [Opitutus sp. WL0086]WRQ85528.1 hypothetical protein K1X11_012015 [Opitutus sp. WL0086]WRQ85544.1 hypothetical protein K1X11_012095 [Opitutus sp. WL0086]
MGAPLEFEGNTDLWVSNGIKDLFCEIVVEREKVAGRDISAVFTDEPAIAGCYGVSGLQIDLSAFFPYFGGKHEFERHLERCAEGVDQHCPDAEVAARMRNVILWALHVLRGGRIPQSSDVYSTRP